MNHLESVLRSIHSPTDLHRLNDRELNQLASEMRNELIGVVGRRSTAFCKQPWCGRTLSSSSPDI